MAATPCPNGCADPCVDWHDWERCGNCHAPFNYWRWKEQDQEVSKKRLGERVYICACLLWTALHDRRLGQRLLSQNPNWSAVCNYYSMVHSLRLFWFILYGSYPTGHAQLAQGLQSGRGASANWTLDVLLEAKKRIGAFVFQALLRDEFTAPMLSDKVPLIGAMFESARKLRNDSNYESLILAHQYFHGHAGAGVHIPDEMNRTASVMSEGSKLVLHYITQMIGVVLRNDHPWIGRGSPYSGVDLKSLLWRYVHDKIRGANDDQHPDADVLSEWLIGLPEVMPDLTDTELRTDNPAHELVACIEYTVFGGKQELMEGFQAKVGKLEQAIGRLTPGGGSERGLFD